MTTHWPMKTDREDMLRRACWFSAILVVVCVRMIVVVDVFGWIQFAEMGDISGFPS